MIIKANIKQTKAAKILKNDELLLELNLVNYVKKVIGKKIKVKVLVKDIIHERAKCPKCGIFLEDVETKVVSKRKLCIYCAKRVLKEKAEISKVNWIKRKARGETSKDNGFNIK